MLSVAGWGLATAWQHSSALKGRRAGQGTELTAQLGCEGCQRACTHLWSLLTGWSADSAALRPLKASSTAAAPPATCSRLLRRRPTPCQDAAGWLAGGVRLHRNAFYYCMIPT